MTAWETIFLWAAIALYSLSGGVSLAGMVFKREGWLGAAIFPGWMGLLLHGSAILLRWAREGHGPYMGLFESLSSDLWMGLAFYLCTVWRFRRLKVANGVVMPITFTLMGGLMLSDPSLKGLPPAYPTAWLVVHLLSGKLCYGSVLVAVGLAALVLARERVSSPFWRERIPETDQLDDLAYRFMAFGFIFETLMIIAGAIWAQNAWGIYWSWDPMQVWSLSTWIVFGLYFHLRITFEFRGKRSARYILFAFLFSFLPFQTPPKAGGYGPWMAMNAGFQASWSRHHEEEALPESPCPVGPFYPDSGGPLHRPGRVVDRGDPDRPLPPAGNQAGKTH